MLILLSVFALGTAFFLGGTVFWTAAPVLVPALALVMIRQGLVLAGGSRQGLVLPPGSGIWLVLMGYILFRALLIPRIPYQAWAEFLYAGSVLVLYLGFADLSVRRNAYRWVFGVFLVAVILQSMYALSLHYHGLRSVLWLERPASYEMRASGTFICPNHFAQLLQMGIVLALGCLFWPGLGVPLKLVAGYALAVSFPAILLSGSRAGWLGMAAGGGVLLLGVSMRRGWKVTVAVVSALVPLGAGVFWALYQFVPMVRQRVEYSMRTDVRFAALWPDTWRLIEGEGFWGAGPGMYRHVFEQYRHHFTMSRLYLRHAHNEFLHLIGDYGWPMFVLVTGGLVWIAWQFMRAYWRERESRRVMIPLLLLALLVAKTVHSVFDFNVHVLGNMTPFVLLVAVLYGAGLYEGIWTVKERSGRWNGVWRAVLAGMAGVMLLGVGVFGWSSWAEYRMDQARERGDLEAEARHAATVRRWTPFHWRGWTELGFLLRNEAFLLRDEARRRALSDQSRAAYETALRWNPYDRIAKLGLVQLDIREGKDEAVLEPLEALIRLDPMDEHLHIQYGLALSRLGRYEEALAAFQEARRWDPGNRQVQANLRWLRGQVPAGQ